MMLKCKVTPRPTAITREASASFNGLVRENPWLVPVLVGLNVLPIVVISHGFWKNRILKKQLLIEREKTNQLRLEHYPAGAPHHLSHRRAH